MAGRTHAEPQTLDAGLFSVVVLLFCLHYFFVFVLVDGKRTAVEGRGAGVLWLQARVSRDALLKHQHSAVRENSHEIHNTREEPRDLRVHVHVFKS